MSRAAQASSASAPDVTVIVAAFDGMPYVTRCIDSVFGQTLGIERIEIIAVDDGSTDGTGEELDRLAGLCPTMHVVHQENSGSPAHPRNVALARATGRYVFFLDADDYLGAEAMERMVTTGDENGSDMVLGRLVGIGGRKAPRSIFRVNQPRADLFGSRVFWSLNPMKLFRREHLENVGLTFATDLPWGEDMPFVAESYLNASVISIVADYDCVYLTYRDDGNNFTKRVTSAASRLGCPTRLLEMIERYVSPGAKRDSLMTRIFQLEVINILPRIALETDPDAQHAAFDTIKSWVDRWYSPRVARKLSPLHRVSLDLVRRGMRAETLALFPEWPPTKNWDVRVEGDRVFAVYPYFRDPALCVPDDCYEITRRLKAHCHVDEVQHERAAVTIAGFGYIDLIDTRGMVAELVMRRRGGGAEYSIPASQTTKLGVGSGEWNRDLPREESGFEVTLDPSTAASGRPLPRAWWDLWLRLTSEGVTREVSIGCASVTVREGQTVVDDLLVRQIPGAVAPGDESPLVAESLSWPRKGHAALAISGRCDEDESRPVKLSAVLVHRKGAQHRVKVDIVGGRFTAVLPLGTIRDGDPIEDGIWDVALERRVGDVSTIFAVPVQRKPRIGFTWRGLWPNVMRIAGPSPRLVVTVDRLQPRRLVSRYGRKYGRKVLKRVRKLLGIRR